MRGSSATAATSSTVNATKTHTPVRREINLASLSAQRFWMAEFNKFLTNPSGFSLPYALTLLLVRIAHSHPREVSYRSELTMSVTVFLAFCILGCDFLLYVLYQFTYGEKRRGLSRRSTAPKHAALNQPDARPFLVASRRSATERDQRLQSMRQRTGREEASDPSQFGELRAYRRIASSFAQAKR